MIVFYIMEEEFEVVNDMDQKTVDRYMIGQNLEDIKQRNLINRVVSTQRLGSKSEGRTSSSLPIHRKMAARPRAL